MKLLVYLFITAILVHKLHGFQILFQLGEKHCFLENLEQEQRFALTYEVSDQENIDESKNFFRYTFRNMDTNITLENDLVDPQETGSFMHVAAQRGCYEYCFVWEQGKGPLITLTFYTVLIPTSEEQARKTDFSMTKENQVLVEDLQQLLYTTLAMKQDQKTLVIREERHKQSKW
jgi:hypothetical protein